ncbi:MAG: carbohydrate porin [Woeseiaceae bacterium]
MHIARSSTWAAVVALASVLPISSAADEADGNDRTSFLGGPNSIPAQLEEQDDESAAFFERLETDHGLNLAVDYASMFQGASDVIDGDSSASSGALRIYGTWTLVGRGTRNRGSIVAKVEHRHAYSEIAPAGLASNVGYLGASAIGFTDVREFVAPVYWQQFFGDGRSGFFAGRVDPLDFVDVLGVGSQWTSFQNGATLANLSLPLPDLGCGAGAGRTFNDQWIVGVTAHDLNGSQTNLDCFAGGLELYKQAYVGWSPSRAQRFNQTAILTVWHADSQDNGTGSGSGVALSANWTLNERWMPFVRVGVSSGEAAVMKTQVSAGLTITFGSSRSQIGAAISYQDPAIEGLDNQTTLETYARWQITPALAISPNLQILRNPALNPDESTVVLGGLRIRYTP